MATRCFIAIELDQSIIRRIGKLQNRLIELPNMDDRNIKWTKPNTIHMTLKFLGDVEDYLIPEICNSITKVAQETEPFDFEIGNLGCFPPRGPANVMWIGVRSGSERLLGLQKKIDLAMQSLHFPPDKKKFNAHTTLARVKDNFRTGKNVRKVIDSITNIITLGPQPVNQLTVFQSDLTKIGPKYTVIHTVDLSPGNS